jgi:hypothetical protein
LNFLNDCSALKEQGPLSRWPRALESESIKTIEK